MGAAASIESALTAVVLVGAVGVGYHQYSVSSSSDAAGSSATKTKKKKRGPEGKSSNLSPSESTPLVDSSSTIPGQFHDPPTKPKKSKRKKTEQQNQTANAPPPVATSTDESWTRVDSRRQTGRGSEQTSDAVITTSLTETSSAVEQESPVEHATLAEKLIPKPPKTDVDDMLPPQPVLSRVMRIQPLPNEKPAPGFSWGDYEDVQVADGESNDADGEDDGWGVVRSKRPRAPRQEAVVAPELVGTLTKKQRQNANRREAQKAAKAAAEAERVAKLDNHKRELERIKMMEQSRTSKKGKISGGMTPVVDDRGKLVWE